MTTVTNTVTDLMHVDYVCNIPNLIAPLHVDNVARSLALYRHSTPFTLTSMCIVQLEKINVLTTNQCHFYENLLSKFVYIAVSY